MLTYNDWVDYKSLVTNGMQKKKDTMKIVSLDYRYEDSRLENCWVADLLIETDACGMHCRGRGLRKKDAEYDAFMYAWHNLKEFFAESKKSDKKPDCIIGLKKMLKKDKMLRGVYLVNTLLEFEAREDSAEYKCIFVGDVPNGRLGLEVEKKLVGYMVCLLGGSLLHGRVRLSSNVYELNRLVDMHWKYDEE